MMRGLVLLLGCAMLVGCNGTQLPSTPGTTNPSPTQGDVAPAKGDDSEDQSMMGQQNESVTLTVRDFEFVPSDLNIPVGATVVWKFEGPAPHTSTSVPGSSLSWDSGTKNAGETYSMRFDTAGTFDYSCTIHPRMRGRITVSGGGQ